MSKSNRITTIKETNRGPKRWFPIEMDVYFKYHVKRGVVAGNSKTVGISSREVWFKSTQIFKLEQKIELTLRWPATLGDTGRLKLVVFGWVMETGPAITAVKIERYQFRVGKYPTAFNDGKQSDRNNESVMRTGPMRVELASAFATRQHP